ncbi:MAG: hypothetical protein AAB927_03920 [Patescibacteria group bacterium]
MYRSRTATTLLLSVFLSLAFFSLSYAQVTTTAKDPAKDPANAMCKPDRNDVAVDWTCEYDGKGATNAKGELCMLRKHCREITEKKYLIEGRCRAQLRCSIETYTDNYPECLKTKEGCKKRAVSLLFTNVKNETGAVPNAGTVPIPAAGTGTNVPWQSLPPQLTAQQITAAFENSAAKPLDAQYAVNPVTGQLESLNAAGQSGGSSGDSNGATGLSTQASQNYNYFGPPAGTVSDLGNPVSQVNEALGAPQSVQGSEFSSQSGFGPAEQKSENQTPACTSGTWICWAKQVYTDFTGGNWGGSAQAGTGQTDAEVTKQANEFSLRQQLVSRGLVFNSTPEQSGAPAADVEVKIAANDMPRTGLAIIVENSTVASPAADQGKLTAQEQAQIARSLTPNYDKLPPALQESAGRDAIDRYNRLTPQSQAIVRDIAMQSIQSGQNSGQGTGVSVPTLQEATPNTGRGDQTALQMKVSSAPAPLPAFRFATEESAKPPDARNVDAQSNQYLFAVWKQCPSSDIPCAQRAANLLQAYAGESVENCPECQTYADKLRSGYKYENLIGGAPLLNDPNMSAPTSVLSTAENALQIAATRRADLERAVADYVLQGPSPEIQNIIQNTEEGTLSKFFSVIEDKGKEAGAIASSQMPGEINSVGDLGKTIGWGVPGILGSVGGAVFGSARNLAEMTGVVPGFTGDLSRELGRKIDPTGAIVETTVDGLIVSPLFSPIKGITTTANKGIDYALGLGETGIVRSEPGVFGMAGARTAGSDMADSGAGLPTTVTKGATEAAGPGAAEGGAGVLGGVTRTGEAPFSGVAPWPSAGTKVESVGGLPRATNIESAGAVPVVETGPAAQFNRATEAIKDFMQNPAVETKAPETLGGMPKSGTIFDAPARTAPASGPTAALDSAVAEARAIAAGRPAVPVETPVAEVPSAVVPATEKVARSGSLDVSAGPKILEPEVEKMSMKGLLGGTTVVGGVVFCIEFCTASKPSPQEQTLTVDLTSEKEHEAQLPKTTPIEEPPAPVAPPAPAAPAAPQAPAAPAATQEVTPPAAPASSSVPPAAEEAPKLAAPQIIPPGESGAPKSLFTENKDAQPAPPQSVNLGGPKPGEPGSPEYELQERRQRAAEEAERVASRVEAQRLANQREQEERERQWEAQRQAVDAEIARRQAELDARIEAKRIADEAEAGRKAAEEEANKLPLPVVAPPVPGSGAGPTAEDIATGLGGGGSGDTGQPVSLGIQFRVDSAALTNRADVEPLGKAMKELYDKGYTFNIQGNTDPNTPSSRWNNNNDILGLERAKTIQQTLSTFYGIPLGSITISTMGARNPIYGNSGNVNYEASRRVIVTATPPKK